MTKQETGAIWLMLLEQVTRSKIRAGHIIMLSMVDKCSSFVKQADCQFKEKTQQHLQFESRHIMKTENKAANHDEIKQPDDK